METQRLKTFKLILSYDGTRFKGWQRGNGRTVQGTLEEALGKALGSASRGAVREAFPVEADGAGRTDAGVHAESQVASARLPAQVEAQLLLDAANRLLPEDLALLSVEEADERFHARYRARAKTYRYRLALGAAGNPFLHRFSFRVPGVLDERAMRAAAAAFVGELDFSSFTADKGKKDKVKTVLSVELGRSEIAGGPVLDLLFRGEGFLWNQVRIMAAALVAAGKGELDRAGVEALLAAKDRSRAPGPLPACGLCLVSVEYDHA